MDDLVQWLRAQLTIDAARAEDAAAVRGGHWSAQSLQSGRKEPRHYVGAASEAGVVRSDSEIMSGSAAVVRHAAVHDPARVLREIDAKRQLVNAHSRPHECIALTGSGERSVVDGQPWELWEPEHTNEHGPCTTLRLLALPYSDRPGYKDDWRP